jgi:hypothetical protein
MCQLQSHRPVLLLLRHRVELPDLLRLVLLLLMSAAVLLLMPGKSAGREQVAAGARGAQTSHIR